MSDSNMTMQCKVKEFENISSFICVCSLNGFLSCKAHLMEHIDKSINTINHYAELIAWAWHQPKRKSDADILKSLDSQTSAFKTQFRFLNPNKFSFNPILHNINNKISKLLAKTILQINDNSSLNASYINKINFTRNQKILRNFKDLMTEDLQDKLFSIILQSRENKNLKYAASNAITILNYSKYEFINKDLRGVEIEGANLSEALIINSNFQGSNLKKVDFSFANIYDSNFCDCDLTDAWFGQYPPILDKFSENDTLSWCGDYLAYAYGSTVVLHNIHKGTVFKEFKHNQDINAIGLSRDGRFLAAADWNYKIHLWDIDLQKELMELKRHSQTIKSISFSPNGEFFATVGNDCRLRLWNIADRRAIDTRKLSWALTSVSFSSCSKYIALGFWHLSTVFSIRNIELNKCVFYHPSDVINVSFSCFSRYLITSCNDFIIRIWDTECGQLIKSIKIWAYKERPSGKNLFNPNSLIKFWAKYCFSEFNDAFSNVFHRWGINFSPDQKYAAVRNTQKSLKIWDAKALVDHPSFYKQITSISFSHDEKYIALTNASKSIKIHNVIAKRKEFKLKGNQGIAKFVAFSRLDYFLVSLYVNNYIILWDVVHQFPIKQFEIEDCQISAVDVSFNCNFIGTGFLKGHIKIWNILSPSENNILRQVGKINCIKFSPSGEYIAASSSNSEFRLWRIKKKNFVNFGYKDLKRVLCFCFTLSGKYLVLAYSEGPTILWDIHKRQKLTVIQTNEAVTSISPCGDLLITGSLNDIKVWNIWQGNMIKKYNYHSEIISSIQYINKKSMLVAAGTDDTIKFFSI
ncbi:unnamed protein product [Blepharisma stoltei]|uniref:Anaphase-promoting complex subunit 4-like WD40 domain-containing protein n=1 Tax=Blepharisma stoltei TaxID=1481888 RepID=A0AAU9K180_9CILI|nr:unnamed protein product [Blepharisma stoltei]